MSSSEQLKLVGPGSAASRLRAREKHPKKLLKERPAYTTDYGALHKGDSAALMAKIPEDSVDLVVTSPPYALQSKKEYGNADKSEYVEWFRPFGREIFRILKPTGSFVLNIGGSYNAGEPTRSLYHFRVLLMLCDEIGFSLAQECFWFNTAKLPSPAVWVNVRRIRIKDSVEYLWWLSKTPNPKADNTKVLVPYGPGMLRLLGSPFCPRESPSGHKFTQKFTDRGGSIPPNVIARGNTESNSDYIRNCKAHGLKPHPARYPAALPEFFIDFLTDPFDLVVDPFAGSNTTGSVAEGKERLWLSFELEPKYIEASKLRFGLTPRV